MDSKKLLRILIVLAIEMSVLTSYIETTDSEGIVKRIKINLKMYKKNGHSKSFKSKSRNFNALKHSG